ncbi:nucleoprotein [Upolu virus]|uniref:Nucleoprotein n=1 Tax=Upolu virus TaxID=1428581 RepID=X2CWU1_9ORTO|nr:nucleoprotein [Upolu virus]AHB34058.1 nucleoprotein [Upolu virus]
MAAPAKPSSDESSMEVSFLPIKRVRTGERSSTGQTENLVPRMYEEFRAQMFSIATSADIPLEIDHNAEVVGSIVMAACTDNKELRAKDTYHVYMPTEGNAFEYVPVEIDTTALQQWAKTHVQTDEARGRWYPFLALVQLSSKTKDSILWQKSSITQELEVSPSLEVYACGHNIKDRLKNSRPRSIGPLVHLVHLKRIMSTNLKNSKTKRPLESSALHGIKKSIVGHLKRQCIGDTQKVMINQFESGNWSALSTFAASLLAIKPRIENHFVLNYPLIAACTNFKDATMSSEWVYETMETIATNQIVVVMGPDPKWYEFLNEIYIHCVFQSAGEDLGLLSWMFDRQFHQRRDYGRFCKKSELKPLGRFKFNYKYWSKPLKSAPRSIQGVKRGQISCRPSFKGKRASFNNFTSLDDLQVGSTSSGLDLFSQVQEECKKYMDLETEGTTDFYSKGGTTVVPVPDGVMSNMYLLG